MIANCTRDAGRDDRLRFDGRHSHGQQRAIRCDELAVSFDHTLEIVWLNENRTCHQQRTRRRTGDVSPQLDRDAQFASALEARHRFGDDKDRRATGTVRGDDHTIQHRQPGDLQLARPGIAHQDGWDFAHRPAAAAGLRLPAPNTPRKPK
jgi:hypothetical protein